MACYKDVHLSIKLIRYDLWCLEKLTNVEGLTNVEDSPCF